MFGKRKQTTPSGGALVHDKRAAIVYVDPFGAQQQFWAEVTVAPTKTVSGATITPLVVFAPKVGLRESVTVDKITRWTQPEANVVLIEYGVNLAGGLGPKCILTIKSPQASQIVRHMALSDDKKQAIGQGR